MGSVRLRCELIVVAALAGCGALANTEHVQAGGHDRTYLLHLPAHPPAGRYPLVLVFHGGGGTARGIERETRFDELADREGFAAAYPQGVGRHWNDGRSGNDADDVDDVGYLGALIDRLVAAYPIDPSRVFVTGISNGGFMSYRLACQLSDKVAAAAPRRGAGQRVPGRALRAGAPRVAARDQRHRRSARAVERWAT